MPKLTYTLLMVMEILPLVRQILDIEKPDAIIYHLRILDIGLGYFKLKMK